MSELGKNPPAPVNKYIRQYASRLATHHIELKDPDNPEAGNTLVPNEPKLLGRMSLTDGMPIVTEAPEEQ